MINACPAPAPESFPAALRHGRIQNRVGRATALAQATRLWLLILALWPATALFAQQKSGTNSSDVKWEVLTGCRLVTNSVVDGDSFRVLHQQREYIFRLYFVDAPEADAALKDRIKDQATYFGISPDDIPRAAKLASQFTRDTLSGGEFIIITRWQNALGRSKLPRFYGIVLVTGKNLAEELVTHGHARIYGLKANWPDGPRSTTFINKLKNLELTAREEKRGVWDETKFPRLTSGQATVAATNSPAANEPPATTLVDINTASYEELQKLPGIGPKIAERIIAHRPYQAVKDLDKVSGIGPVKLKQLKPLISVGNTPP